MQLCSYHRDGDCEAVLALSLTQGSVMKPREIPVCQGKKTVTGTGHRNSSPITGFVTDIFPL